MKALDLDATAQAELVRRGEVTSAELVEGAIERIEALNPKLNAVIHRLYDKARSTARDPIDGPFQGVPFLIKDIVAHTAGDPYHCGMRVLKEIGWTEKTDSWLAQRFRRAGFVIVGKTNTPELACAPTTEPLAYGPARNPWNTELSPSGSSGGSAAAVASGMVAVAHGNDMGGSIRTPASACGLVGLKPTRARSTLGPAFGELWWALTHEHVLTRSVRDTAGVLDAIRGPGPGDPYTAPAPERPYAEEVGRDPGKLRIGVFLERPGTSGSTAPVHADCAAAVQAVARTLATDLGHDVDEGSPEILTRPDDGSMVTIIAAAIARDLARWSERIGREIRLDEVEAPNAMIATMGRATSALRYVEAVENLQAYSRELAAWWESYDILVTPTLAEPPWPIGLLGPNGGDALEVIARWTEYSPFCMPFNVSGQPAISLPLGWNEAGLPIGVQLVAAYGREDVLVRLAAQLEQAMPWRERRPEVAAPA